MLAMRENEIRATEWEWIYIDSLLLQFDASWVSLYVTRSVFNNVNGVPSLSNLAHTHQSPTANNCWKHHFLSVTLSLSLSPAFISMVWLLSYTGAHTQIAVLESHSEQAMLQACKSNNWTFYQLIIVILIIIGCVLGNPMKIFDYYNVEGICYLPRRCCTYFNWSYLTFSLCHTGYCAFVLISWLKDLRLESIRWIFTPSLPFAMPASIVVERKLLF